MGVYLKGIGYATQVCLIQGFNQESGERVVVDVCHENSPVRVKMPISDFTSIFTAAVENSRIIDVSGPAWKVYEEGGVEAYKKQVMRL